MPPPLEQQIRYYGGSPLSGPQADSTVDRSAPILGFRGTAWFLAGAPEGFLPLASETRLILDQNAASPLSASAALTVGARITQGEVAARWLSDLAVADETVRAPLGDVRAVLLTGATTEWLLAPPGLADGDPRITLLLAPTAGGAVEVALQVAAGDDSLPEVQLFNEDLNASSDPYLVWIASPFTSTPAGSLVVAVEIDTLADDDVAQWREERSRAETMVRASTNRATELTGAVDAEMVAEAELRRAMQGLSDPVQRQACLVFLAHASNALLTLDVVMIADEPLLARLADKVNVKIPARDLGWHLESLVYQSYALALADRDVHDALDAVLLWHTGEVGRANGALEDVVRASTDLESLHRNLIVENTFALGDSNPGGRVRAYDWLVRHGAAPENYDPMASARERHHALAAAEAKRTGNPTEDGPR